MPYSDVKINGRSVDWVKLNGKVWWARSAPPVVTYTPILPDDTNTYPMHKTVSDNLFFAVKTSNDAFGYYCPTAELFDAEVGMTGTVIERVEYATFDGSQYVTTGYQLTGADTVEMDFAYSKSGCNIFGSWRSSNVDVFTLYASTNRSYVRYGSSLYRETSIPLNTRTTYRMTPTGDYLDGVSCNTWTQLGFQTEKDCIVGWLDGSSSPKLEGSIYEFKIENHVRLLPVKIGTAYYLFDALNWSIPAHTGTLDGGTITGETIPWPTSITPTGDSVLFDSGYVDGIGWSANLLTRPNYTTYTTASLSAVETDGIMKLSINSGSNQNLSYNCHVATTDKITIPANATKMIVRAKRAAGTQAILKFGLLGDDYVNSCTGTGGVMTGVIYTLAADTDHELTLPAGFAGSSAYRAVINIQDAGGTTRGINISKVWFDSGSAPLTMGNPFSPDPEPEPDEGEEETE